MSTADAPFDPYARQDGLDVLRGVAVLMIFAVNVRAMFWPFMAQMDPAVFDGPNDLRIDLALQYLIDGKWIAVFAVLFGAGLALIHDKALAAGGDPKARIVRRQSWLLLFGLLHLYLVWLGDVLTVYAVTGLVAMTFLGRRLRTIAWWAGGLLLGFVALFGLIGWVLTLVPAEVWAEGGGDPADPFGLGEMVAAEIEAKRGGYPAQLAWRAEIATQQLFNVFVSGPMVLSYMLTGIVLFRTGFLTGGWRVSRYLPVAAVLLAFAWSADYWRTTSMGSWSPEGGELPYVLSFFRFFGLSAAEGLAGGVGYAALVMAAVRAGLKLRPLAAAGRMAFTNYIACSLIGTTLAYGHGAGLFGEVTLAEAMIVVVGVWAAILVVSPLWLTAFRYGPLEWLWRSLSYGRLQPFLKRKSVALV